MKYNLKSKTLGETIEISKKLTGKDKEEFELELFELYKPALEQIQKILNESIRSWQEKLEPLGKAIAESFTKTQESFSTLRKHGWIVTGDMTPFYINLEGVAPEEEGEIIFAIFRRTL